MQRGMQRRGAVTLDSNHFKSIEDLETFMRLNPNRRAEVKSEFLHRCLNDGFYLQKIIGYDLNRLKALIEYFPNEQDALLEAAFQNTNFIKGIVPFRADEKQFKYGLTLTKLLSSFPRNKELITRHLFANANWLYNSIHSDIPIWKLKYLSDKFPGFEDVLFNNILTSLELFNYLDINSHELRQPYKEMPLPTFLDKLLTDDSGEFLTTCPISDISKLLDLIQLFPRHAEKLFDHGVKNEKLLKSIKLAYSRVDEIELVISLVPFKSEKEVYEKLFNRPELLVSAVCKKTDPGEQMIVWRKFKKLTELFPHCKSAIFSALFQENASRPVLVSHDLISMIHYFPNKKQYFYDTYLAKEKDYNSFIFDTKELVQLMKLYPQHELEFLYREFTKETFISWQGLHTGYTDHEWYYQNYIAQLLHANKPLQEEIFNKAFASEEQMKQLRKGKTPNDLIENLAVLVKYFPQFSGEIFKLTFPDPTTLEKALVDYHEYAPKLAKVFPNVVGINEGEVFDKDHHIRIVNAKPHRTAQSVAKNMFSYFGHHTHKLVSNSSQKVGKELEAIASYITPTKRQH